MSTAAAVRDRISRTTPGEFLTTGDLRRLGPGVETELSRLTARGELVRVRRGLYWRGMDSRFGHGRPDRLSAALKLAGRGAGPTGWSASHELGLSTQFPATPSVAVIGRPPKLDGVKFHVRSNVERALLNRTEVSLLECLRDYPRFAEVDLPELRHRVVVLARDGIIDPARVLEAASHERSSKLHSNLAAIFDVSIAVAA